MLQIQLLPCKGSLAHTVIERYQGGRGPQTHMHDSRRHELCSPPRNSIPTKAPHSRQHQEASNSNPDTPDTLQGLQASHARFKVTCATENKQQERPTDTQSCGPSTRPSPGCMHTTTNLAPAAASVHTRRRCSCQGRQPQRPTRPRFLRTLPCNKGGMQRAEAPQGTHHAPSHMQRLRRHTRRYPKACRSVKAQPAEGPSSSRTNGSNAPVHEHP